jgi:uncharacterized secreted protein with C-terminal beta-propeller domain
MGWRGRVASIAAMAAVLALAVGAPTSAAPSNSRLQAFSSCAAYLGYVKAQAAPFVTAYGLGLPVGIGIGPKVPAVPSANAAPQQGVDYSGTNVQEAGVDEPDIVKTNGATLFAVENGSLEAVDVGGGRTKLLDTLKLDAGWSHELLLSGRHLLVLSRGGFWAEPLPALRAAMSVPQPSTSTLTEVDVSDPAALKVVQTLRLDGAYLDARMIGSTVRVVSSTPVPDELPFPTAAGTTPAALAAAQATNRGIVASSRAAAWLPSYRLGKQPPRPLVNCRRIRRPAVFSGLGLVTVTTLDLAKGLAPLDSTSVMTDGRIVYASPTALYLATEPWAARPLPLAPTTARSTAATQIHAFSIADPTKTTYLGSGSVPGYLLSQWSLSEFGGALRVVSTDAPAWWGDGPSGQSYLTELRLQNGALSQVGQVDGLGRGDRVYAVRLIGQTGYVVTFKQVDPLYTLDLRNPAHPQLLGRLDLPGYSSYLHPISSTLLLGIGQSLDQAGTEPDGTEVSLFDVADPRHPTLLKQARLGQGWSLAESDHHAFLYWPATNLVVIPFGQQAVAMRVSRTGISELGRIIHSRARQSQLPQIDRSLVVGNALLTVSSAGTAANRLTNLAGLGWASFPPPEPVPGPVPGAP